MTDTPTIAERLRRLHHLYLAEASAVTVDGDDVDSDTAWLRRTVERRIDTECQAILEVAADRYRTNLPPKRVATAFLDLRRAAYSQVRLRLVQDAYRSAEKSSAIIPKSQLIEKRKFLRGQADRAEHAAMVAIRAALDVVAGITDADLAERRLRTAEPNG